MKVKDILQSKGTKVWSISSAKMVQEAVQILTDQKIGALLVLDQHGEVVGIITERDILRGLQQFKKELTGLPVQKIMTERVIIGNLEDDLDYIMNIMTHNRVRHIPVLEEGKLQGIISIGDVVKAQLHDSQVQIKYLKDYMHGS